MRVRLDSDLCQGHGVCCQLAPAVFQLDRAANRARILQEEPGPAEHEAVRQAVRQCPTFALEALE